MPALSGSFRAVVGHVVRAHARLPAFYTARLRRAGAPDQMFRLRNVSRAGFMGEADQPVTVGGEVRLVMPFGPEIVADVRWSEGTRVGCEVDGSFTNWQLAILFLLAGRYALQGELRMLVVSLIAILSIAFM